MGAIPVFIYGGAGQKALPGAAYDEPAIEVHQPDGGGPRWPALVIPSVAVGSFRAGLRDIYGRHGVEIMASLIREHHIAEWLDDPGALEVLLHGHLHLGVLASAPGEWQAYYPDSHEVAELPHGDAAYFELPGEQDFATWWFFPQVLTTVQLWLFLYHNGELVPFAEMAPGRLVDDNGGIRIEVVY